MDRTICSTEARVLVSVETLSSKALVPMLMITAKPMVTRNSSTSITEELMISKTTINRLTPIARVLGRSVGIRSSPSEKMPPNSSVWFWISGSCSRSTSRPCFIGEASGRYRTMLELMLICGIRRALPTVRRAIRTNSATRYFTRKRAICRWVPFTGLSNSGCKGTQTFPKAEGKTRSGSRYLLPPPPSVTPLAR